ncbi:hypothetical protein BV22DRAFT_976358, partial [Leucogyrophana mollusca]
MMKRCSTVSCISNLKGHANKKLKVDNSDDEGEGKENMTQQAWSPTVQEVEDMDAPSLPPASPSPPKQHRPWAPTVEEVDDEDALFEGEKGTNADSGGESDHENDGNDGIHDKRTKFKQSFTPPPTISDAKAALADVT